MKRANGGDVALVAAAVLVAVSCAVDARGVGIASDGAADDASGGSMASGSGGGSSGGSDSGGSDSGGSMASGSGGSSSGGIAASAGGVGGVGGVGDMQEGGAGSSNEPGPLEPDAGLGQGGACALEPCAPLAPAECAVDTVSAVPFMTSWSSVGRRDLYDGGCDSLGTPDYALVFGAPQAGTYRITSAALVDDVPYTGPGDPSGAPEGPADGDSVMTVVRGGCAGPEAQQQACNDDGVMGLLDSQLDLTLDAGEIVTVYLNELGQTGGGTGTVTVTLLP